MLALRTLQRGAPRWLATRAASTTPVALVGCGMPGRGMGWYHAKQILDGDVPSATLTDIVEPWFLGGGKDGPGGAEFAAFKAEHEGKVRFHASIADMPKPDGKMMAMVCTRRPRVYAPRRRRRASSPREEAVGGFFFDFRGRAGLYQDGGHARVCG